jgi:hypothetical protein
VPLFPQLHVEGNYIHPAIGLREGNPIAVHAPTSCKRLPQLFAL